MMHDDNYYGHLRPFKRPIDLTAKEREAVCPVDLLGCGRKFKTSSRDPRTRCPECRAKGAKQRQDRANARHKQRRAKARALGTA